MCAAGTLTLSPLLQESMHLFVSPESLATIGRHLQASLTAVIMVATSTLSISPIVVPPLQQNIGVGSVPPSAA